MRACSVQEGRCGREECLGLLKAPALICNNTIVPYLRRGNIGTPCNGTRPTAAQCAEALAPEPEAELWTVLGV